MTDEEAVIGQRRDKHAGFGISVFVFRRLEKGVLFRATTLMLYVDVVKPDVFNFVSRNAADNGSQARGRIRANHVTDVDPPQFSYGYALGSAHAAAEPEEDGGIRNVAHGDVVDGYIFQQSAIDGLQSKPAAEFKDAVGYGDVLEPAVGFLAELDPPCRTKILARQHAIEGCIQQQPFTETADEAIGDSYFFCGSGLTQGGGALDVYSAMVRRVHAAIGDANVATTIDIDSVAVGVDGQVV